MSNDQKQKRENERKEKTKRETKRGEERAPQEVFLFLISSDQEKFCRWQKIRFYGQVAEIALLVSQLSTHLSGAEMRKTMS